MLCLGSFPGLARGSTVAFFQIWGILLNASELFMVFVRYAMAIGPRCFKCIMEMLSGPNAGEFFANFMAFTVSSTVKIVVSCVSRFLMFRMIERLVWLGLVDWKFVSSLLSCWAMLEFVWCVCPFWNVMAVLLCVLVALESSALIVLQSVLEFFLWSNVSRCLCQVSVLWFLIFVLICVLSVGMSGSLGFVFLSSSLALIRFRVSGVAWGIKSLR